MVAWTIGFMQYSIILLLEFTNMAVMLTNQTMMDLVLNFLALVILAELDDILFETVKEDPIGQLITEKEFKFGGEEPV